MTVTPPEKPKPDLIKTISWWGFLFLAATFFWGLFSTGQITAPEPVPYSRFESLLEDGKVKSVVITGDHLVGSL